MPSKYLNQGVIIRSYFLEQDDGSKKSLRRKNTRSQALSSFFWVGLPLSRTITDMDSLLLAGLLSAGVAVLLTPVVITAARRFGIVDRPGGRRIHALITPRLGGVAVLASFFIVFLLFLPELSPHFKPKQLLGFSLAALLLLIVGIADDVRGIRPSLQLASHAAAGTILVLVGMGIEEVSNPFGGKLALDQLNVAVPIGGVDHFLTLPADLLTIAWVVLVINAVNWLDGLDGLATGVGGISAIALALLSVSAVVGQDHVALLALILAGALAGFLVFNFQPAKIFLGTVGSTFVGFTIATLAIISGGKVATALLVLGFPILDALTIILRRFRTHGKFWQADTTHLHHRLLARGFSVRQSVLIVYALTASFGALALLGGTTKSKALAFGGLVLVMLAVLAWLARPTKEERQRQKKI